jgi:hypothetical protein
MTQHRTGLSSFLGIGVESTYGTRVVPTTFIPFNTESLSLTQEFVSTNPLQSGVMVQPEGLHRSSTRTVEGSFDLELYDRGMGKLLNMLHGNTVSVTTPGGATLSRQQVHNIGLTSPVGKGLSVQVARPDVGGTVRPFDYVGCKITEAVITVEAGSAASVSFTVDGRDELTDQVLATPTYVTAARPFTFQDCTFSIGGSAAGNVKSATITIPLGMATDRYMLGNAGVKEQPLLNEFSNITVATTLEFASLADHTRFRTGAPVALKLDAVGAQIEAGHNYQLTVDVASAKQVSSSPVVSGPDVITSDAEFEAKWNGSVAPVVITTKSTDTAL